MECVNCQDALGGESSTLAFVTHDGEPWCPQCFCWKRSFMEPDRYYPPGFIAIRCGGCRVSSVAIGGDTCGQCGSRNVVTLPPKVVADRIIVAPPAK